MNQLEKRAEAVVAATRGKVIGIQYNLFSDKECSMMIKGKDGECTLIPVHSSPEEITSFVR